MPRKIVPDLWKALTRITPLDLEIGRAQIAGLTQSQPQPLGVRLQCGRMCPHVCVHACTRMTVHMCLHAFAGAWVRGCVCACACVHG